VVFNDAKYKFFLTASLEARAERRFQERVKRGERVSRSLVEAEMRKRDHQDETRLLAPLKAAKDAKVIDSTNYTPEEVFEEIVQDIKKDERSWIPLK
jgi:cytidylate kinase